MSLELSICTTNVDQYFKYAKYLYGFFNNSPFSPQTGQRLLIPIWSSFDAPGISESKRIFRCAAPQNYYPCINLQILGCAAAQVNIQHFGDHRKKQKEVFCTDKKQRDFNHVQRPEITVEKESCTDNRCRAPKYL
jgi:hypothetical protein